MTPFFRRLVHDLSVRLRRQVSISTPFGPLWIREHSDEHIIADEVLVQDSYRIKEWDRSPPRLILDVGANVGCFARAARAAWPSARIVCVEPAPATFALLKKNTAGLKGIRLVRGACVNDDRKKVEMCAPSYNRELYFGGARLADIAPLSSIHVSVRVGTAPALRLSCLIRDLRETPDLLKLDCEGAEICILEDLSQAGLLPYIRVVWGEYHPGTREPVRRLLSATHEIEDFTKSASPQPSTDYGMFCAMARTC